MCDQSKSLATSFMCGQDLDNYLKNQYYAGPFTQGTRMLNKYRTESTNPCIDHYENLQFKGSCKAVKNCIQNKKTKSNCNSCQRSRPQPKQNCGCNNNKPSFDSSSDTSSTTGSINSPTYSPPKRQQSCPMCPKSNNKVKDKEVDEDDDPISRRCKQLYNRGKTFLRQIEQTLLPKILIEEDEYLPSVSGGGWEIATTPKILGKSKFQIKAYDPYLMLHSWQAMQGISDNKSMRDEQQNTTNSMGPDFGAEDENNMDEEEQDEEEEEELA